MTVYVGHPTLKDGIPPLTERQQKRLDEWLTEIADKRGIHIPGPHALSWRVENEYREGRGHDVEASIMDGERFAWLSIDVYGNGNDGWGEVTIVHNEAFDECRCKECEEFSADENPDEG